MIELSHNLPAAVGWYQLLVSAHVVFAVAMVGAAFTPPVIVRVAIQSPRHTVFAFELIERLYRTVVLPGLLLVMLTGFWQISAGGLRLMTGWLGVSIVLVFVVWSHAVFGVHRSALAARDEAMRIAGPDGVRDFTPSPAFLAAAARVRAHGLLVGACLTVIIVLMVAKPF